MFLKCWLPTPESHKSSAHGGCSHEISSTAAFGCGTWCRSWMATLDPGFSFPLAAGYSWIKGSKNPRNYAFWNASMVICGVLLMMSWILMGTQITIQRVQQTSGILLRPQSGCALMLVPYPIPETCSAFMVSLSLVTLVYYSIGSSSLTR